MLGQGLKAYELKDYPGMPHSACPEEFAYALDFLKRCLPDDPSFALPPPNPTTMSVKELKAAIAEAGLASQARGFSEKSEFVELLASHFKKSDV